MIRKIHLYVGLICGLALVALALQDWSLLPELASEHAGGFAVLLVLGLLSESMIVKYSGSWKGATHTITFIPLLCTVILFGPAVGALYLGFTSALAEFFVLKKEAIRTVFNAAQHILATCLAGWVYSQLGGIPLAAPDAPEMTDPFVLGRSFLAFTVVLFVANHAAVSIAVSISQGMPLRHVWARMVGKSGAGILYDVLVSPIAVAVAILYMQAEELGLLVAILPLLFIRHAYLINYQLTQANTDLLSALVKAIETRDPYTSGHSQRVSSLARLIAERLHLSEKTTEDVCTAALLHDIGKIESVFIEILRKPDDLTPDERRVIESHVLKGVELLESLSSFNADVISAVRHHHERVDGKGYPDGLGGAEISLGGRIIKISDAIDAMLSDRPYRKALSLSQVREQLSTYAAIQFDRRIVEAIVSSDLLESHADAIRSDVPAIAVISPSRPQTREHQIRALNS